MPTVTKTKRGVFVIIGTNDMGDLKKFKSPDHWAGGILAVWYSGSIYMSVPHRRVGKLAAVTPDAFWEWMRDHHINPDKVYTPTANEFSRRVEELRRRREDALVEGIAAQMLAAVNKPKEACPYCGCTDPYSMELWPNQDWPRCPNCHGC